MELTGANTLPVPRERVWEALFDPDVLKASIPGCESVEVIAPGTWRVVVIAAVGPVKACVNHSRVRGEKTDNGMSRRVRARPHDRLLQRDAHVRSSRF